MQVVGNWNYAGTQKFVSHALNADGSRTLCGMSVSELMARRGQQWEESDSESCGCAKCRRHLTPRAPDDGDAPAESELSNDELDTDYQLWSTM
jgi:hypothetical protein